MLSGQLPLSDIDIIWTAPNSFSWLLFHFMRGKKGTEKITETLAKVSDCASVFILIDCGVKLSHLRREYWGIQWCGVFVIVGV